MIASRASSGSLGTRRSLSSDSTLTSSSDSRLASAAKSASSSASSTAAAGSDSSSAKCRAAAATFSSSAYRLVSFLARPASAWTAGSESSSCTRACSSSRTLTLAVRVSSAISAAVGRGLRQGCRLLDLQEELDVRARVLELGHEQFDGLLLFEAGQQPTQLPHHLRLFGGHEHLFATGARGVGVDGREDALVRELAAEAQLHIACSLELLEDDLVHLRSGLDQRRGEDGQRTAALDVACG